MTETIFSVVVVVLVALVAFGAGMEYRRVEEMAKTRAHWYQAMKPVEWHTVEVGDGYWSHWAHQTGPTPTAAWWRGDHDEKLLQWYMGEDYIDPEIIPDFHERYTWNWEGDEVVAR